MAHSVKMSTAIVAVIAAMVAAGCSVVWSRSLFGMVMGERLASPSSKINVLILITAILTATLFVQILFPVRSSKLRSYSLWMLLGLLLPGSAVAISLAVMTLFTFVFSIRIC